VGFASLELIMKIADECFMPFGIGGGINSLKDMKTLLKAGAEKVIVNTAAYEKPDFIKIMPAFIYNLFRDKLNE